MKTEPSTAQEIVQNLPVSPPFTGLDQPILSTIMIIAEAENGLLDLLQFRLHEGGYETVRARNHKEAYRLFEEAAIEFLPLGILKPGLDSWAEFRRHYRGNGMTANPVIMLTTLSRVARRDQGVEQGDDACLGKLSSIHAVLSPKRSRRDEQERVIVTACAFTPAHHSGLERIKFDKDWYDVPVGITHDLMSNDMTISHGYCPDCSQRIRGELFASPKRLKR